MSKRRAKRHEQFVMIERHEWQCPAWQTLSTDARALLIEMRALYTGQENRVYMSVREAMRRLNIGQRRVQRALSELLERGWIRVLERGAFSRKVRHATVYELTNQPQFNAQGHQLPALKTYMSWRPSQKNTVAKTATQIIYQAKRAS